MSEKEQERKPNDNASMDNPEQYKTDKKTLTEMHEEEMNVDPIPMEDLKQEKREEKDKRGTKDSSSSEEKFPE
ncbi:hypothetical protein GPDM_07715 [Planococcus donghaensis MPA1U2]|uniref:Uncharacterized protein n=1 Tax=Planococcus donghaensis MPA1U2 TaxID=933115 RepID=E7RGE5_9BACL|nr:hypothetical protein [Planococcus donghaensis]EGA89920.1 hypothetical protein GPDM_07715 [Planococcus donghaensis MPA1U2]